MTGGGDRGRGWRRDWRREWRRDWRRDRRCEWRRDRRCDWRRDRRCDWRRDWRRDRRRDRRCDRSGRRASRGRRRGSPSDRHERRYPGDLGDRRLRRRPLRPAGRLREPRLPVRGLRDLRWRGPGLLPALRHQRPLARHLRGGSDLRAQPELSATTHRSIWSRTSARSRDRRRRPTAVEPRTLRSRLRAIGRRAGAPGSLRPRCPIVVVSARMALSATVYHLQVELSDVDRGVYESLDLRVARHPSETMRYLLTRVIGYCLCYEPGIAFSKGLSSTDEPAVWARDLQGQSSPVAGGGDPLAGAPPQGEQGVAPRGGVHARRRRGAAEGGAGEADSQGREHRGLPARRRFSRRARRGHRPQRALVAGAHRGDAVRDERRRQSRDARRPAQPRRNERPGADA